MTLNHTQSIYIVLLSILALISIIIYIQSGPNAPALVPEQKQAISFNAEGWSFANNQNSAMLVSGWSDPEITHRWSEGGTASVSLALPKSPDRDLKLTIGGVSFINDKHPVQHIEVVVNGSRLETLTYDDPSIEQKTVLIPGAIAYKNKATGEMNVTFNFKDSNSPQEAGLGKDPRKLGLALKSLKLGLAGPSPIEIDDDAH
jgi:hypothetical protein